MNYYAEIINAALELNWQPQVCDDLAGGMDSDLQRHYEDAAIDHIRRQQHEVCFAAFDTVCSCPCCDISVPPEWR